MVMVYTMVYIYGIYHDVYHLPLLYIPWCIPKVVYTTFGLVYAMGQPSRCQVVTVWVFVLFGTLNYQGISAFFTSTSSTLRQIIMIVLELASDSEETSDGHISLFSWRNIHWQPDSRWLGSQVLDQLSWRVVRPGRVMSESEAVLVPARPWPHPSTEHRGRASGFLVGYECIVWISSMVKSYNEFMVFKFIYWIHDSWLWVHGTMNSQYYEFV